MSQKRKSCDIESHLQQLYPRSLISQHNSSHVRLVSLVFGSLMTVMTHSWLYPFYCYLSFILHSLSFIQGI